MNNLDEILFYSMQSHRIVAVPVDEEELDHYHICGSSMAVYKHQLINDKYGRVIYPVNDNVTAALMKMSSEIQEAYRSKIERQSIMPDGPFGNIGLLHLPDGVTRTRVIKQTSGQITRLAVEDK